MEYLEFIHFLQRRVQVTQALLGSLGGRGYEEVNEEAVGGGGGVTLSFFRSSKESSESFLSDCIVLPTTPHSPILPFFYCQQTLSFFISSVLFAALEESSISSNLRFL